MLCSIPSRNRLARNGSRNRTIEAEYLVLIQNKHLNQTKKSQPARLGFFFNFNGYMDTSLKENKATGLRINSKRQSTENPL